MSCFKDGALIGGIDLRPWSGQEVADFGGGGLAVPLTIPNWGIGEGLFFDAITALNGRGRAQGLPASISAGWPGGAAGTATASWDPSTGTIRIVATDVPIALEASPDNERAGFPAAGMPAALVLVAPSLPESDFTTSTGLVITPTGFASYAVLEDTWVDTFTVEMHERGSGSVEDLAPTTCLEEAAVLGVDGSMRIGLPDDGHVVIASAGLPAPIWLSTSFRDELGFTGNEVPVTTGAVSVLRAARQLRSVALLSEGWDLERGVFMPGDAADDLAGGIASNNLGRFGRLRVRFPLTGPGHTRNDHLHWLLRARPGRGEPLSFYPLGPTETRRARDPYDVTASSPAHSLTHTTARQGYGGRFPARLHAEASDDEVVNFESGAAIRSTPVEVLLSLDPTA